jgi:cold shock CspA family protein
MSARFSTEFENDYLTVCERSPGRYSGQYNLQERSPRRARERSPVRYGDDSRARERSPMCYSHDSRARERSPVRYSDDSRARERSPVRYSDETRDRNGLLYRVRRDENRIKKPNRITGIICSVKTQFGFIKPSNGDCDIFFHNSGLPRQVPKTIEGQRVTYIPIPNSGSKNLGDIMASDIRFVNL